MRASGQRLIGFIAIGVIRGALLWRGTRGATRVRLGAEPEVNGWYPFGTFRGSPARAML